MDKAEFEYFVAGLKSIIKRDWPSQEKFAEGVTSKVNLSNILRHQAGTSQQMREKLARKAGQSVEDVIYIGMNVTRANATDRSALDEEGNFNNILCNPSRLRLMRSHELLSKIGDYSLDVNEKMMNHAKEVGSIVRMLAEERNRNLETLQFLQSIIHSINSSMKVIDEDMRIVYCKQAPGERYRQNVGDYCDSQSCFGCDDDCLVKRVFKSGHWDESLVEYRGSWLLHAAYPVEGQGGKINYVVIMSREMSNLPWLVEQLGWDCTRPPRKKDS